MSPRFRYSVALTIGFFALLAVSPPLSAEVREKKVCVWSTSFPDADEQGTSNNDCFTGHTCIVGVRGKWLDLTDHITVESGPNATVSNYHHGVGDSRLAIGSITTCVPQGSNSEGFISLKFTPTGTGTMRIKMTRPSLDGGDQDIVTVNVLKGDTFIATNTPLTATDNEPKELRLTGGNLNLLQLKNPSPGDEILEKTDAVARVRLTFAPGQSASLDTRLQFAGPEPAINARYGWPMVRLSSGGRSAPPAAVTGPNVVPTRPSPLFRARDYSPGVGGPVFLARLDESFCSGLLPQAEREQAVPSFTFTVENKTGFAVTQAFTVEVTDSTGRVLHSEVVPGLAGRASQVISVATWPGRQQRVNAKNDRATPCQNGPCGVLPGRSSGCVLEPLNTRTVPDPTLIIRVDTTKAIPNEAFGDNTLTVRNPLVANQ